LALLRRSEQYGWSCNMTIPGKERSLAKYRNPLLNVFHKCPRVNRFTAGCRCNIFQ
jgi:hypothetical protein